MGQKVNPHGLRVGVIKDWDSRWFVKDSEFGKVLVSDYNLRKYLKETLFDAGIPKIEIERNRQRVKVIIHCAKPGKVIGRGGSEIENLRKNIERITEKPASVNVIEVKTPDLNAQLVSEAVGAQLIKRVSFRRAMKQAIGRTMKLGAKGIKIQVSGILGATDIARTEHYHEGTIPLQTIRADIDYGYYPALTKMGLVGVKVWIYKGEVLTAVKRDAKSASERQNTVPRKDRPRFDRGGGDNDKAGFGDRRNNDRPFNRDRNNNNQGRPPYGARNNAPGGNNASGQGGGFRPRNNAVGGNNAAGVNAPRSNYGNRRDAVPVKKPAPAATPAPAAEQGGSDDVKS